jgi:hypothetical protein
VPGSARLNPPNSHRSAASASGPWLSGGAPGLNTVRSSLSRMGARPQSQGGERESGDAEVRTILEEAKALTGLSSPVNPPPGQLRADKRP